MFKIPVLFLIFARPDTTKEVFDRIKQIRPARLYVAADAPRKDRPDEIKRSEETRQIIQQINWPCEIHTLFREENLGCKIAVSSAITWFFEQEEYGIILEDDCLPDLSFFPYCEELLLKYKDDDRIGHISGNCFLPNLVNKKYSYDFCSFSHIWGWASWRRVWKNYDVHFRYWEIAKHCSVMRHSLFNSLREEIYFSSFLNDAIYEKRHINTWDTQYLFMLRVQRQLSIYPSVNLVKNIGLGDPHGTHTNKKNEKVCISACAMNFPMTHPIYKLSNTDIDRMTIKKFFFSYKRLVRYFLQTFFHIEY